MRNIPLQFVAEESLQKAAASGYQYAEAAAVARPLRLDAETVAEHWPAITNHKWLLSERLGRDVGAKVAALDYFENIDADSRPKAENWLKRLGNAILENLDADGPRSLANFEGAMRGTRSLAQ